MIDAAYWHLAKRYNAAFAYDPNATAKLEDLNEAYIVLGSAQKREEYMKLRVAVLGEGALPQTPGPAPVAPPLAMMSRQRPQERAALETTASEHERRPVIRVPLGAVALLGLVGAGLAAAVSLQMDATVVTAAIVTMLAVTAVGMSLLRLRRSSHLSRHSAPGASSSDGDAAGGFSPGQLRRLAAEPEDALARVELAAGQEAGHPPDPELPSQARLTAPAVLPNVAAGPSEDAVHEQQPGAEQIKHPGHDQFAEIKRQAAQFRRIAESQGEVEPDVSGSLAQNDPNELARIKEQTERLKRIAANFNAAKGQITPEPPQEK
jgi:hypothetical protein